MDLYTWDEISRLLDSFQAESQKSDASATEGTSLEELASLYLMIAIGAQCRGRDQDDLRYAAKFLSNARKIAFDKMLQDPTLNLVRIFLLMAFYMLGACRRNSAFMYIGVASKAADILGLAVSAHCQHLSPEVRDTRQASAYSVSLSCKHRLTRRLHTNRLRTAKSLRVLDVVCSSILGRRSSVMPLRSASNGHAGDTSSHGQTINYRALALGATYELCAVIDTAVTQSSNGGGLDTVSAQGFLQTLRQRSQSLPAALRKPPVIRAGCRDVTIAQVHVAGTYYFGVILVTRHFLIQRIIPQLRPQQKMAFVETASADIVAELSGACVEAATYMAEMCHQVMKAEALLGNMCIVKYVRLITGRLQDLLGLTRQAGRGPLPQGSFWGFRSLWKTKLMRRPARHSTAR